MIDWIAIGGGVAAVAVPLARRYASKKVVEVIDAFAIGDAGKMPAKVKEALDAAAEMQLRAAFEHLAAEAAGLEQRVAAPMAPVLRDLLAQRDAAIAVGTQAAIAEHNSRLADQASAARQKALTITPPRGRK